MPTAQHEILRPVVARCGDTWCWFSTSTERCQSPRSLTRSLLPVSLTVTMHPWRDGAHEKPGRRLRETSATHPRCCRLRQRAISPSKQRIRASQPICSSLHQISARPTKQAILPLLQSNRCSRSPSCFRRQFTSSDFTQLPIHAFKDCIAPSTPQFLELHVHARHPTSRPVEQASRVPAKVPVSAVIPAAASVAAELERRC